MTRTLLLTALALTSLGRAQELSFSNKLISADYTYGYGIGLADLDKDGDLDIVSSDCTTAGSRKHNDVYWYENDAKGGFVRHFLAKDDWHGRYERLRIADINRDSHPDVVIVDNFFGNVSWFENSGHPGDGRLWKKHDITSGGLLGAYDVDVADIDRDGWLDVAASSWRLGNRFVWYRNPGIPAAGEWQSWVIDSDQAETRTVAFADFNRDGRADLLGTVTNNGILLWYECPPDPKTQPWRRHVIDLVSRPIHGHPADIDGDGDLDVIMAHGGFEGGGQQEILWYENVGGPGNGIRWTRHDIARQFEIAFEAIAADIDGDGRPEVIASAFGKNGRIAWFQHAGDPRGPWTLRPIAEHWPDAVQIVPGDVDRDGRIDIVGVAERGSRELRWWRNQAGAPRAARLPRR
jgi:hypothetical protein